MKCYTLTSKSVLKGIQTELLPVTAPLALASGDVVMEAIVVPVTPERDGIDFLQLFTADLQRAVAVCSVIFTIPEKKTKSDKVLVGYDPRDWYPNKSHGDKSTIVYRSPTIFTLVSRVDEMVLSHVSQDTEARLSDKGPKLSKKGAVFAEIPNEEDFFIAYIV